MQLNELKGKTDMIILLSHLGIHDDEKIAELYPQVDLILGGHTHHILHEGKQIKYTIVSSSRKARTSMWATLRQLKEIQDNSQ